MFLPFNASTFPDFSLYSFLTFLILKRQKRRSLNQHRNKNGIDHEQPYRDAVNQFM